MFDFFPIEYYTTIYYNSIFIFMVLTLFNSLIYEINDSNSIKFTNTVGFFLLFFITFYMGLRPISGKYFVDMGTYNGFFNRFKNGENVTISKDFLFNYFIKICAQFMSAKMFFLLIDVIYIIPIYIFAKKYFKKYWFYAFFMFVGSLSFWAYGTNGLRNGMATSLFIFALCFYNKKTIMYLLMAISFGFHSSMVIPIFAFIVTSLFRNPKIYLYIWLFAIPLSLIGGSSWENLFGKLGFYDERALDYLTKGNVNNDNFAYTGFRWDFLFYSAFAVFAGWYYIFKLQVKDKFYTHLWGLYLIANAFWILVIRANFSNRFAYLSWFLMAPVIIYPILKYKIFDDQHKAVGIIIAAYYLFTFTMFIRS